MRIPLEPSIAGLLSMAQFRSVQSFLNSTIYKINNEQQQVDTPVHSKLQLFNQFSVSHILGLGHRDFLV